MAFDVEKNSTVYAFDGFRLDIGKRLLYRPDGESVPLKAKAFETLLFLVENSGRVVERDELLAAIWPDTVVEENNLTQHISSLRRVFEEKPDEHRFIATIPGRGYKFVAPVYLLDAKPRSPRTGSRLVAAILALALLVVAIYFGRGFFPKSQSDTSFKGQPDTSAAGPAKKIAVLPFKVLSVENDSQSLADAMTFALISRLEKADGISVFPHNAVKHISPDQDPVEAGRKLEADVVVEATMQITPNRDQVRVSVRAFDTSDSKPLWAGDAIDEDYKDVLAAQDSMSEKLTNKLRARLSDYANRRYTDNSDAYVLYNQGRVELSKLAPPDAKRAIRYFEKAIERDPDYALAFTGISDANMTLVLSGEQKPDDSAPLAIEAAKKAVEMDPELAEGYRSTGITSFWFRRDWQDAETAFKKALALDPNSAPTRLNYAHLLTNMGFDKRAIEQVEDARKLDSLSAYCFTVQGIVYHHAGKFEEALSRLDQAIARDPKVWLPHMFKSAVQIDEKQYELAVQSARNAYDMNPQQTMSVALESYALAKLGRREDASKLLDTLLKRSEQGYVPPYHIAIAHMGLGDNEKALTWLEKSYSENDAKLTFLKVDHIWDPLRSNPQFMKLMTDMNFE